MSVPSGHPGDSGGSIGAATIFHGPAGNRIGARAASRVTPPSPSKPNAVRGLRRNRDQPPRIPLLLRKLDARIGNNVEDVGEDVADHHEARSAQEDAEQDVV